MREHADQVGGAVSGLQSLEHHRGIPCGGAGKLVVCNFSPSLSCSDLGKYGGFVALAQSLFHYVRPTREQHGRATAGKAFRYPVDVVEVGTHVDRICDCPVGPAGGSQLGHILLGASGRCEGEFLGIPEE